MSRSSVEEFPLQGLMLGDEKPDAEKLRDTQRRDERVFNLLFLVSFPLFFLMILVGRLMPGTDANAGSILAQARAATGSTIAIVLSI